MATTLTDKIKFKVNGIEHEVGSEVTAKTTLVDYVRKTLNLPGTKNKCGQGNCGACVLSVSKYRDGPIQAVNSCLVSVMSCHGWIMKTIEGLGNKKIGYHELQKMLADDSATQCGHCTPGWIMSMYSLLQGKKLPTMRETEQSLSSNICRCTGYRSIFKTYKVKASDAPNNDKEDAGNIYTGKRVDINCDKKLKCDGDWCCISKEELENTLVKIQLKDDRIWYKVSEIEDIFEILEKEGDDSYMLVAGNTAKGLYPISEYPRVLIDISGVDSLKLSEFDQNLVIGSGLTLTDLLDLFEEVSKEEEYFWYLEELSQHLQKVAHIAVRNLASIAGNLMLKHQYRDFASDIFLLLECVGAQLILWSRSGSSTTAVTVTMQEFLDTNMKGKVIVKVILPPLSKEYKIVTFKIMPRSQAALAIVSAAYLFKLTDNNIVSECSIVYSGLSEEFTRASITERYLVGKNLFTNETLQKALNVLDSELVVTENPPKASVTYRHNLALALIYKAMLSICPEDYINEQFRSGGVKIHNTRSVSTGTQVYKTDSSLWPINQPIPKIEALIQCAGEAFYTDDLPNLPHEVFAAFVLATVPTGEIETIDAIKALNYKGVIAFYTAKDIPGINSFTPADDVFGVSDEEIFCELIVKYHSQPLGLVVAETKEIAEAAAKLVEVTYKNVKPPVLTIEEAKNDPSRITLYTSVDATRKGDDVVKVIKSSNSIYSQYHFAMENMTCLAQPTEEGLKVQATVQFLDATQLMISRALNIEQSRIDVHMRRLGGSYGQKISRIIQSVVACSLAAFLLNIPCRIVVPMQVATKAVGKRFPSHTDFEVGVDASGKIQFMNYDFYDDNGYVVNEMIIGSVVDAYNTCYDKSTWNFKLFNATTDTHSNSWCRGPGNLESGAMSEYVMEQIACELGLDPLEVRLANVADEYADIKNVVEVVKNNSNYDERRMAVDEFNAKNRWTKRGLRWSLLRWSPLAVGRLNVIMSVYQGDGTVALTHGGIEMGQGLNTKAVQMCAALLNIPMHKIQIKENNTLTGPNIYATAASLGAQNMALPITQCCEELLRRLKPIREKLSNPTWEELIKTAFENHIDLQTHGFMDIPDTAQFDYNVFGAALAEVGLDVLTGEFEIIRVDLAIDIGLPTSPLVDLGQIEGAFIMGQGYWTCEELVRNKTTGEMLTYNASNYYVPLGTDIPQDFRIYIIENTYSSKEIFGAKAVGDPSICLAIAIPFAIREAITAARHDSGIPTTNWFPIKGPYTVEKIVLAAETKTKDFQF